MTTWRVIQIDPVVHEWIWSHRIKAESPNDTLKRVLTRIGAPVQEPELPLYEEPPRPVRHRSLITQVKGEGAVVIPPFTPPGGHRRDRYNEDFQQG